MSLETGLYPNIYTMKVTILQRDIVWANPTENRERINRVLDQYPDTELFVLPEMFSTGFCTQPQGIAEPAASDTLAWMKTQSEQRNCALAGSVAIEVEGHFYNRFYFTRPNEPTVHYDKHHLFTYGGEHKRFNAGNERIVVTYRGIRFLLQICYDLRFPVFSRNLNDYDVALYVASWPTPRVAAWRALLVARAIENQCYVIGVNRVGTDIACDYCGGSAVIDAYGNYLAQCPDHTESEASAVINLDELAQFRTKFPVLNDTDTFTLTLK